MKATIQHDTRDCGATCLKMIAEYYGLKLPISKCREITKTDKVGTNIYGLVNGAKQIGLSSEALEGSKEELLIGLEKQEIKFPFVAHIVSQTGLLHFVVVQKIKNKCFYILDPEKGKVKIKFDSFFEQWTGYIISFSTTTEFQKGNYTSGGLKRFLSLLRGQYIKLLGIFLISLAISAIGIIGAFIFQLTIDNFGVATEYYDAEAEHTHADGENCTSCEEEGNENIIEHLLEQVSCYVSKTNFSVVFTSILGLYILQAGIQFVRGYLILSVSKKIDVKLILTYYNHIIDLPVDAISTRQTGEYLSRFSEAGAIRDAVSGATLTILLDSIMVIGCGTILYLQNAKLFGISLIMIIGYAIIVISYRKPIKKANQQVMQSNAILQSYFKESIDGIESIKSACAEKEVKESTNTKFMSFINSVLKTNFIGLTQDILAETIELIGTIIILWWGFEMVLSGEIELGALITYYVLLSYFSTPIKNLIQLQPEIQSAIVAAERLNDILDLQTESYDEDIHDIKPEIWEMKNVDFRYGYRELTLNKVSLYVRRGEKIALVGESGSGKSTIAKLLLRFYEAENGSITVGTKEIHEIPLTNLRENIAYIDQNSFMFTETIENNLRLGNSHCNIDEIKAACQVAGIAEFIEGLPLKYQTPVDENGSNLSKGQQQRLSIARALLKKPQLLILDEATSNLDSIAINHIKNNLAQSYPDMACIIIAHRMSNTMHCNRIYVLEKGRIVECGTHNELIAHKGKYYEMWNLQ